MIILNNFLYLTSICLYLSSLLSYLVSSTEIICAELLRVVHVTSHSAVLQWSPVVRTDSGYYELWYNSVLKMDPEIRRTLPFDSTSENLTNLQPDTTYTVSLRPESNQILFNTLTVNFTTLPGERICRKFPILTQSEKKREELGCKYSSW